MYSLHLRLVGEQKKEFEARTSFELPREQQGERKRLVNQKLEERLKALEEAKRNQIRE